MKACRPAACVRCSVLCCLVALATTAVVVTIYAVQQRSHPPTKPNPIEVWPRRAVCPFGTLKCVALKGEPSDEQGVTVVPVVQSPAVTLSPSARPEHVSAVAVIQLDFPITATTAHPAAIQVDEVGRGDPARPCGFVWSMSLTWKRSEVRHWAQAGADATDCGSTLVASEWRVTEGGSEGPTQFDGVRITLGVSVPSAVHIGGVSLLATSTHQRVNVVEQLVFMATALAIAFLGPTAAALAAEGRCEPAVLFAPAPESSCGVRKSHRTSLAAVTILGLLVVVISACVSDLAIVPLALVDACCLVVVVMSLIATERHRFRLRQLDPEQAQARAHTFSLTNLAPVVAPPSMSPWERSLAVAAGNARMCRQAEWAWIYATTASWVALRVGLHGVAHTSTPLWTSYVLCIVCWMWLLPTAVNLQLSWVNNIASRRDPNGKSPGGGVTPGVVANVGIEGEVKHGPLDVGSRMSTARPPPGVLAHHKCECVCHTGQAERKRCAPQAPHVPRAGVQEQGRAPLRFLLGRDPRCAVSKKDSGPGAVIPHAGVWHRREVRYGTTVPAESIAVPLGCPCDRPCGPAALDPAALPPRQHPLWQLNAPSAAEVDSRPKELLSTTSDFPMAPSWWPVEDTRSADAEADRKRHVPRPLPYACVSVVRGSPEWLAIDNLFEKTRQSGTMIVGIARVQNPQLWRRHRLHVLELREEAARVQAAIDYRASAAVPPHPACADTTVDTGAGAGAGAGAAAGAGAGGSLATGAPAAPRHAASSSSASASSASAPGGSPGTLDEVKVDIGEKVDAPDGPLPLLVDSAAARLKPAHVGTVDQFTHSEMLLWHGTSNNARHNILLSGFQAVLHQRSLYGVGNYFSSSARGAMQYRKQHPEVTHGPDAVHELILARVAVFRARPGANGIRPHYPPGGLARWDALYDLADPHSGRGDYWIMMHDAAAYPAYVISYILI